MTDHELNIRKQVGEAWAERTVVTITSINGSEYQGWVKFLPNDDFISVGIKTVVVSEIHSITPAPLTPKPWPGIDAKPNVLIAHGSGWPYVKIRHQIGEVSIDITGPAKPEMSAAVSAWNDAVEKMKVGK